MQLDGQDNLSWHQLIPAVRATNNNGCSLYQVYALPTPGHYVVAGSRSGPNLADGDGYLARYDRPASGGAATAAWEVQFIKYDTYQRPGQYLLGADQSLTVADWGNYRNWQGNADVLVTRFAGLPAVYEPDLCATPPVPNGTYALPAASPDSLNLADFGTAGPPYAQLLHWRWELGDGTVVERTTPGWVRYRYRRVPAPGTRVRLTITNNLGCTSTQELYPWGRPTAAQQAQALAAGATLWPNPASGGAVQLRVPGLRAQGPISGQLLDGLGRELRRFTLRPQGGMAETTLPLDNLPAGVYSLRLLPVEGVIVKRLVKQ